MDLSNKFKFSTKHVLINKDNNTILIAAAVTVAVVMFAIVASATLIKQIAYQSKVIGLREKAKTQLVANTKAIDSVLDSYKTFEGATESVIGTPDKNSKIVLDALPSKYDFPALATSLESLVKESGAKLDSISGTDNEAQAEQDSANPQPIEIPFDLSATGKLASLQLLVSKLEHSIRPIKIKSISFNATGGNVQVTILAVTYYQPEKQLGITESVVPFGSNNVAKGTKQ